MVKRGSQEYIHHQKQGKIRDGMEDFLMEHDNRHQRMHTLLFKPLKCWCCGELNEYDLPEGIKGLILLDAVNLSEEQEDLILGTTGTGEACS